MRNSYTTKRLVLNTLQADDAPFIYELVNTPGWLQFIGDRNIANLEDADKYITKTLQNPAVTYWVVSLADTLIPIGVITLIKRDYLAHHDIGFAFLPAYTGSGYAYEAACAVLNDIIKDGVHTHIVATTVPKNINSIRLLEKMGLQFSHAVAQEGETLHVYAVHIDKLLTN